VLGPVAAHAAAGTAPNGDGTETARAMAELLAAVERLDHGFSAPQWQLASQQDLAEARRMLLHTLLHALQTWLEADPARPFFTPFVDSHKKLLVDNPDARYFSAAIDDRHRYRIRGNLAGATYTSFTVELGIDNQSGGLGSALNDTQFRADANGDYEIVLSRDKVPGNWMPLPVGASSITTRHYYELENSINNQPLHHIPLAIENLDRVPPRSAPDDAAMAAGIRRVTAFVTGNVTPMSNDRSPPWVSRLPNRFAPPQTDPDNQAIGFAAKDNVYAMAPFLLEPDQALLIRGRFPRARYAGVLLHNRFMQTFDYETRSISRNRKQTVLEPDGSFRMVVAHRDPGVPNWLDTEGRRFGMMFWRFLLPEEPLKPLVTEVVPVDSLA